MCFDTALAQAPDSEHIQLCKLKLLMLARRYDDALAITTKMLKDRSSSTAMLQVRAKCYYYQVSALRTRHWGVCARSGCGG